MPERRHPRPRLHDTKGAKIVTMIEAWIYREGRNDMPEFLVLRRRDDKGGFWQPVCGRVEAGESLLDAALREVEEETCIRPSDIRLRHDHIHSFTMRKDYLTGERTEPVEEHVFAFKVDRRTEARISENPEREHDESGWLGYEQALAALKWEDNKAALRKLMRRLLGDATQASAPRGAGVEDAHGDGEVSTYEQTSGDADRGD
jgi:8-oxo-dGTP pyrophosphatase MutT (NUDIX family)